MKQLQAGYIIDGVEECLLKTFDKEKIDGLLKQLSFFDMDTQDSIINEINNPEQILFVANNIISRGLPTRISLELEKTILNKFNIGNLNKKLSEIGSIKYDLDISESLGGKLFRAIHIIEPRISLGQIKKIKIHSWENHLGSEFEEDFLYNKLPKLVNPFWTQIIESQRELENILRYSTSTEDEIDKFLSGSINLFNEQMIDFSIEFPYKIYNQRGLIVEIDGSQHEEKVQKRVDENRDNATDKAKWGKTIRIKTKEWHQISEKLKFFKELENEEYFKLLKLNYTDPLYQDNEGQIALQLLLVPFAIARIQKTIVNLLISNKLDLSKDEWNIAIIERDITGSKLAIDDLTIMLNSLFRLKGESLNLPKINLFVENTDEFKNTKLSWTKPIDRDKQYDLFIDLSILQRSFLQPIDKTIDAKVKVNIRSSHSPKTKRKFFTTELIKYKALGRKNRKENKFIENKNQVKYLKKFVQDIFRKEEFRTGQVEIINRAIQTKSVIGLLPTGSGKSLAYQLTVLLQPGLAIVVDPIKSLMKDQYEGLLKNKIDCSVYINSSLKTKEREFAIKKINNATILFAFISPERFQIDTFRKELIKTSDFNKNYFSYCVIDEAHCVSEWGHDFRTSYLRLGDSAKKYCKTKTGNNIPFFALTATASYDVLSDIQRELKISGDNAIVRSEKLDRRELQFKIKEVVTDIESNQKLGLKTKEILGEVKQEELISEILEIPQTFEKFIDDEKAKDKKDKKTDIVPDNFIADDFFKKEGDDNNAGLVFCPHRNWYFGVTDNAANISQKIKEFTFTGDEDIKNDKFIKDSSGIEKYNSTKDRKHIRIFSVGTFMGSDNEERRDESNEISQSEFIQNRMDLLVATKAFGMGIDKPNIRYVIHFNYPSSIESYYQEVGRAGRDKKIAIGIILFNQQEVESKEIVQEVAENGEVTEELVSYQTSIDRDLLESFHRNSFKGIAKEKRLLGELLTEIKFPTKRIVNQLEDSIIENFGIVLQLRTYTNKNGRLILYLNPNYGSIYLGVDSLPFYRGKDADKKFGQVVNFIRGFIQSNKLKNQSAFDLLNQFTPSSKQDGIEKLLENTDNSDKFIVVIPFVNDNIELIANIVRQKSQDEFKKIKVTFTEKIVDKAQRFCQDIDTIHNKTFGKNLKTRIRFSYQFPF